MDELTDIYKRIEYLRNNGVKMKEIADRVDMAPSVLSALYSSVLPAYIDLLKTRTPDEALDEALALYPHAAWDVADGFLRAHRALAAHPARPLSAHR